MEIKVGQLYEVVTDLFITTGRHNAIKRPVILKKGEIIEIRFAYEWHFRTKDNHFFHAEPITIKDNCKFLGEIYEPVLFANKACLVDIIRIGLYNKNL